MYAVPDFNITNIVNALCLQKVVLAVGARCVMSFIYRFYGPFKHIPLNRSSWVSHLTFHKQNLAFASAPPVTALTELFFFIHSRLRHGEKYVSKYQLLTVRAISDQGICNSAKQ